MVVNNSYFHRAQNITGINNRNVQKTKVDTKSRRDFKKILQNKIKEQKSVRFSKHAEMRLKTRNITLTEAQKNKLDNAVTKAEAKGVKDSLVLMESVAFVVNVKNRTVITAVGSNELSENVFTNIDGAVFAK